MKEVSDWQIANMAGKNREAKKRQRTVSDVIDLDFDPEADENKGLRDQVRILEEEKKQLQVERNELRDVFEELRGMVECPVCLVVPRQGRPVPVCSNGHFLCHPCRDRIRQDTGVDRVPKCPSCTV